MTDDAVCPDPTRMSDTARLAVAVLAQRIADETSDAAVSLWASSLEDVVLGFGDDEPGLPLSALRDAQLGAVHGLVVVAVAACDDKPYRQWLIELGRMITDLLTEREWDQLIVNTKAVAIAAEEQARDRANRPPQNLEGLPSWRELSGPAEDPNPIIEPWSRVSEPILSVPSRIVSGGRRSSGYQSERR